MFACPQCNVWLEKMRGSFGVFWRCPSCDGRSATIAVLRKSIPADVVNSMWQTAKAGNFLRKRHCPACSNLMAEIPASIENGSERLDVCTVCQLVWFDTGEYDALPTKLTELSFKEKLPQKAREKLAIMELDSIRDEVRGSDWGEATPDEWWQWIPGLLGMPVEEDVEECSRLPWVTWSLAFLIFVVSVIAFFDLRNAINDFGLIPAQYDRYEGLTLFTSFFLHGGVFHLLGNLYFLLVFGDNAEDRLGKWCFILLVLCASMAGDFLHIMGDPASTIPCIGASGGVSGIITFYALTFPRARLTLLFRIYFWFRWVRMPAYAMLFLWIALQFYGVWAQLAGFSNVSSLAHVGGVAVGFVFWLFARKKIFEH